MKEGENYAITTTGENVNDFLGVIKFADTLAHEKSEVDWSRAWPGREVGGSILSTEATVVDGKGKLTLTGKLGDVMRESAQAAMSYVRSWGAASGLPRDFYRKYAQPARSCSRRRHSERWASFCGYGNFERTEQIRCPSRPGNDR